MKNSTSLSIACSWEISVRGGIGGRGLERLLGVCGGLFNSLNDSLISRSSSAGLGMEGSLLEDRKSWEGRDFFESILCELGLCLCPAKKVR